MVTNRVRFLRAYLTAPTVVGAVAPSSRALARALCTHYRRARRPARVLEVGAGTGAVTRYLGSILGAEDELDVCEIQPELADILERDVLSMEPLLTARQQGRARLLRGPVQDIADEDHYDFVISGLPLTAFRLSDVEEVLGVIRQCIRPNGVFSYFEYVGLRRASRLLSLGERRARIREVSARLSRHIRRHQFDRQTVLNNLPPAHARHFCYAA